MRLPLLPHAASLLLGLVLLATSRPALAQTVLDFDDLPRPTGGIHMPDPYGGFRWLNSNWHSISVPSAPDNTFLALSGTSTAIVSVGGADVYFDGADIWSRRGLDANGRFYFILHRDGALVYDGRLDPDGNQDFDGTSRTFVPNYSGPVDVIAIVFTQGGGDWDHLALDNLRFRPITLTPPPRPVTLIDVPYSFSGQQSSAGVVDATGLRSATFTGSVQSSAAGRVRGTLTFTLLHRAVDGVNITVGGRWSLATESRDRPPFTTGGEIATGSILPTGTTGALVAGPWSLTFLSGDPAWPVSAEFDAVRDAGNRPKLKGGFVLTYPVAQ